MTAITCTCPALPHRSHAIPTTPSVIPGFPAAIPAKAGNWTSDATTALSMCELLQRHSRVGGNLDVRVCGVPIAVRDPTTSPSPCGRGGW